MSAASSAAEDASYILTTALQLALACAVYGYRKLRDRRRIRNQKIADISRNLKEYERQHNLVGIDTEKYVRILAREYDCKEDPRLFVERAMRIAIPMLPKQPSPKRQRTVSPRKVSPKKTPKALRRHTPRGVTSVFVHSGQTRYRAKRPAPRRLSPPSAPNSPTHTSPKTSPGPSYIVEDFF